MVFNMLQRIGYDFSDEFNRLRRNRAIAVYGAGSAARATIEHLRRCSVDVAAVLSGIETEHGTSVCGIPVTPASIILERPSVWCVIMASMHAAAAEAELGNTDGLVTIPAVFFGIHHADDAAPTVDASREEIERLFGILEDEQSRKVLARIISSRIHTCSPIINDVFEERAYLPRSIPEIEEKFKVLHGCVIDAGAWNGDSAAFFLTMLSTESHVVSFEPGASAYEALTKRIAAEGWDGRVEAINACLGAMNSTVRFDDRYGPGSRVFDEVTGVPTPIVTIDEVFREEKVGYIKMDIEGSERTALDGAAHIIRRDAPLLAISVYHRPDDLWSLPLMIHEMVPAYSLFLRHHERFSNISTVCYAIADH